MTIQIEDMLGDRVRTIEYICGGVEDSLADRAFITLPIGGREIASWLCKICYQQGENTTEVKHLDSCFVGQLDSINEAAWSGKERI